MHPHLTLPIYRIAVPAQELATAVGEAQVEPEHLLAALVRDPDPIAARVFADLGAVPGDVAATLAANVALRHPTTAPPTTAPPTTGGSSPVVPDSATPSDGIAGQAVYSYPVPEPMLSDRAEQVLNLAHEEASLLGYDRAGAEHVLLGLIREGEGESGRTLAGHCITLERARRAVLYVRATYRPEPAIGRIVTYTYDLNGGLIGRTA